MSTSGRLVVLSGPSCIGKSPLVKALAQFHADLYKKLQPLVLYTSRSPVPGKRTEKIIIFGVVSRSRSCRRKKISWCWRSVQRPSSTGFGGIAWVVGKRGRAI